MTFVVFLSRASASHLSLQYVNPMNCMMRYGVGSYGESATNLFNGHFLCWMVRSKLVCNNSLSLPHYKIYGLFISCRPPILILGSFFSFFSIDFKVRAAEKADGTMWNCVRFPSDNVVGPKRKEAQSELPIFTNHRIYFFQKIRRIFRLWMLNIRLHADLATWK